VKPVYTGKTKDVYDLENGLYMLRFKDDATGVNGVYDPGANAVALKIDGYGKACLWLTDFFFSRVQAAGIFTHYVSSDLEKTEMTVRPAVPLADGTDMILEVICRDVATGSFMRRYASVAEEGQSLSQLVEVTLKDDERGDPLINQDALEVLGLLKAGEYDLLRTKTKKIFQIVKDALAEKSLVLLDIKFEFGRVEDENGDLIVALIDEISAACMRVRKTDGSKVGPIELMEIMMGA